MAGAVRGGPPHPPPVALTHPSPRGESLAARFRALGREVVALPFRVIEPCLSAAQADDLRGRLAGLACVIFVSPGAVDALARALGPAGLAGVNACAVVGPGSAQALRGSGLLDDPAVPVLHPSSPPHDARSLAAIPDWQAMAGRQVLLVHGEEASDELAALLSARGLKVDRLAAYRSVPRVPDDAAGARYAQWLAGGRGPGVVFTAGSTVAAFEAWADRLGVAQAARSGRAFAIHPRIAARLREAGWTRVQTIEPGEAGLAAAIESLP